MSRDIEHKEDSLKQLWEGGLDLIAKNNRDYFKDKDIHGWVLLINEDLVFRDDYMPSFIKENIKKLYRQIYLKD